MRHADPEKKSGRILAALAALVAGLLAFPQVVPNLVGDLNGTLDDRGLASIVSRLTPAKGTFSWPAAFPLARIDHVMTRAATPTATWPLPATGSDHLPIATHLDLGLQR